MELSTIYGECQSLAKIYYNHYIASTENDINYNPKFFWQFVQVQRNQGAIPKIMHLESSRADDGLAIANLFATHFSSIPVNPAFTNCETRPLLVNNLNISSIHISATVVKKELSTLDVNTGAGPDGIPNSVLKSC